MKKLLCCILMVSAVAGAQVRPCALAKRSVAERSSAAARASALAVYGKEANYDVRFVHLDLDMERNTKYVSGNVRTVATVTAASLDTFVTLLHQALTVDSVRFNGALLGVTRVDSMVKVKPATPLANGASFTVDIWYNGITPSGGSAIGSGYNYDNGANWYGNEAVWTLSEPWVAYHWWPCKQMLTDKIDSSWVFITTDSTNKAGSNGVLTNIVSVGSKNRYEWKSRAPIDYYLISGAVAEYREYRQYAKPQYLPNDSILIQNYIYKAAWANPSFQQYDKAELDRMPKTLEFLSSVYGMYPFYKEKYGHCMGSLGGGMEHQTMTTLGFFNFYVDAHELGHQWWGDNVTCKSWGDIFMNEGFADYTEYLVGQYLDSVNYAGLVTQNYNYVMNANGGSCYFTGQDTLDNARVFDSRLTYAKGGALLNMLRYYTNNDSAWFGALRGFQNTYKHSTAAVTDFRNYYQSFTGINATSFFNQWFYGEGYPVYSIRYNQVGNTCFIKNTQAVTMPSVTPLFTMPVQYGVKRLGMPDTVVKFNQTANVETYSFTVAGTVSSVTVDPHNWIVNKATLAIHDTSLREVTGIAALRNPVVGLSPNPTNGRIHLSSTPQGAVADLFTMAGQKIRSCRVPADGTIDLSAEPCGIYLIKVYSQGGEQLLSAKVIREE